MDILQKPNTLLSGIEPKILIILTYQSTNMNGPGKGFIVLFILEGRVGRDIPLNASFEVQELTGARWG